LTAVFCFFPPSSGALDKKYFLEAKIIFLLGAIQPTSIPSSNNIAKLNSHRACLAHPSNES